MGEGDHVRIDDCGHGDKYELLILKWPWQPQEAKPWQKIAPLRCQ